jgi:hypothetical protein
MFDGGFISATMPCIDFRISRRDLLWSVIFFLLLRTGDSFQSIRKNEAAQLSRSTSLSMKAVDRRCFTRKALSTVVSMPFITLASRPSCAAAELDNLLKQLKQARTQMNSIPDLIRAEKWDSVRAILITPPLSDLWTKSARKRPLLLEYADAVGENPTGDELAVLEAKEELLGHLRFLDMAVYNNVFNPIKTEGKTGATKELVRSYYEDPINEYKASVAALDELIQLGSLK